MKKLEKNQSSRRDFLTKTVPACAVSCLAASTAFAASPLCANSFLQEEEHKFDKKLPGPDMTYRRFSAARNQSFINFARFLQQELGEEEVIELIKKNTEQRMLEQAKNDLKRLGTEAPSTLRIPTSFTRISALYVAIPSRLRQEINITKNALTPISRT